MANADSFDELLKGMTLEFFAAARYKITAERLLLDPDAVLLDVRSRKEAETISLPFSHDLRALHIPMNEIPDRLADIPEHRILAVFCPANMRSSIVYAYLCLKGFDRARILLGGYADLTEQVKPAKLWKRLNVRSKT